MTTKFKELGGGITFALKSESTMHVHNGPVKDVVKVACGAPRECITEVLRREVLIKADIERA